MTLDLPALLRRVLALGERDLVRAARAGRALRELQRLGERRRGCSRAERVVLDVEIAALAGALRAEIGEDAGTGAGGGG